MNHYNPNKKNLLVSFSGGRTSAYLCHIAKKYFSKTHNLLFVFANTGKEKEQTLEFVKQCDLHFNLNLYYIEAQFLEEFGKRNWFKIKDFDTLSRNGEPFEAFIKKEGIPNSKNSGCSTRLKSRPIHKFVKYYIGWKEYETAIGIRFDEKHRISWPKAKANDYIYPLATKFRINSEGVRKFWQKMPFDLNLKDYQGNCDLCWKKSDRKLLTMILEGPNQLDWWNDMEIKYGTSKDYTFFRKNRSAKDLLELSTKPFKKAIDEMELIDLAPTLFDFESDMDAEASCTCGEF